jgi:hypothetical protein
MYNGVEAGILGVSGWKRSHLFGKCPAGRTPIGSEKKGVRRINQLLLGAGAKRTTTADARWIG